MPTRAQVVTDIDEKIRDKTVDDKVDNVDDADNRVLTLDYVDQEVATRQANITATSSADYFRGDKTFQPLNKTSVGLPQVDNTSDVNKPVSTATQIAIDLATVAKVLKTTITQSQILTLSSVPVNVLPNIAGKIKIPINCLIIRNGAGTNYTMASNLYINTAGTSSALQIPNDAFTGASRMSIGFSNVSANPYLQAFFPLDYMLTANVSDPTGGTGDIDVYVSYIEITL